LHRQRFAFGDDYAVLSKQGRFLENLVAIELKKRESLGRGDVFYWDNYRQEATLSSKPAQKYRMLIRYALPLVKKTQNGN